jgi:hypothetical protein
LAPGYGKGKKSGFGIKKTQIILSSALKQIKNLNPGAGGKNSDPGSRINIQDPQHWSQHKIYNTEMRALQVFVGLINDE